MTATGWHPIASSSDLTPRTVLPAQILGRELVLWRSDDGYVNVWENRCLHRGVRLTLGINDGTELMCQYHGWRYASRTAGCTYIPAHPADAPARTICNRTYPSVEHYGLVWSGEEPIGDPPVIDALETGPILTLRAIPVNAPADLVLESLETYRFLPSVSIDGTPAAASDWRSFRLDDGDTKVSLVERSDDRVTLRATGSDANGSQGADSTTAVFFVQPVDSGRSVIRAVVNLDDGATPDHRPQVLRHHNNRLSRARDLIEAEAARNPTPEPLTPAITPVSVELSTIPKAGDSDATLRVRVDRKWSTAEDVAGFELTPLTGSLVTLQPGAHIDLHLPNGLVRQYSLVNRPGELDRYRIGVKREPDSRGGSAILHDTVREGDVLAVSEPRNNFTLRRDAVRTVLIAGGIGSTPILAMALTLGHGQLPFELHLFARGNEHLPFGELRAPLAKSTTEHLGLTAEQTGERLVDLLGPHTDDTHVYVCGPGPMIETTRRVAAELGWPDDAIHFEFFANSTEVDDSSSFEIALARSATTLVVEPGQTILEVLRDEGIAVPSSCRQGACGTCLVTVIDGEPLHQDVYLNASERAAGDRIASCVSRATGDRLVLDL